MLRISERCLWQSISHVTLCAIAVRKLGTHGNTSGLKTGTASSTCPKCPGQCWYRSPQVTQLWDGSTKQ